jgi:hypothetical protein
MPTRIFGPSKGNRRPTQVAPSKIPVVRPTAQKGGGGNKEAGSTEVTAATAPTVSVSPTGAVTTEHFGPSPQQRVRAQRARIEEQQSKRRVQRVRKVVRSLEAETPKREVHVSKAFLDKATSPKPVTVAAHTRALPSEPKTKVKVPEHQRALPTKPHIETQPGVYGGTKAERRQLKAQIDGKQPKAPQEPKLKGTPQERQAVRAELKQAKKQVIHSRPRLEGDLGPEQRRFIQGVSKETGLNPRTIAAQARAEESEGAQTEAEQTHNFLNMGPGIRYGSLKEGIDATAQNYNTNSAYAGVRATKGQPPAVQAKAIADSAWGTGPLIEQTLGEVHVRPGNPEALKNYKGAATKAKSLGMKVGPALPDVQADPGTHTIKVKATAKGAVEWAESQINVQENSAKQLKWAANFGLEAGGPWCANMVSNNLARRGFTTSTLPANPNYTPSYEEWGAAGKYAKDIGTNIADAKPGDILTFSGDHTAMYAGNGEMISGNFSDEVMKTPVSEGPAPLSMIIRPDYKGGFVTVKESTPLPGTTSATGTLTGSAAPAAVSVVSSTNTVTAEPKNGKPIKGKTLTARQKINRNKRRLKEVGESFEAPEEAEGQSSLHSQLAALEAKYKIGAV